MSDKNYDIDDILNEVDSLRGSGGKKPAFDGSVTDIIDSDDLDKLLYAGSQKKRAARSAGKQAARAAVRAANFSADKRGDQPVAKQLSEEESNERLARDISAAVDSRKAVRIEDEEDDFAFAPKPNDEWTADVKIYEKNMVQPFDPDTASTTEVEPLSEHVKPFVKPEVSGEDDDIIFHTRGDLVTTETMEMKKQQKIQDINAALLKADSEAESPEEMLDLINPMESQAKIRDMMKADSENTDTLTVAGNDLKKIAHGGEHVREYQPASARKKDEADEVLFTPAGRQGKPVVGELHVGETILDALNKKIAEEDEQKFAIFLSGEKSDATASGKLIVPDAPEPAEPEEEEDEKLSEIKAASELARKKKRRIANFILDTPDNTEEQELASAAREQSRAAAEEEEAEPEEEEEAIDLDDENVIRDRLSRASKGLISRLIILGVLFGVTLFIAIANAAAPLGMPFGNIISIKTAPENYLYTHLTIGILSLAACSSVLSNGFARLGKLRPDGDTLCAFAHSAAILSLAPYLFSTEYIQRGRSHVYLLISLGLLCFNTISKLITVKTAQKNFAFTSREGAKYFIEHCEKDGANQLAKGAVMGIPSVAAMRKTEMLYDFIISTYCEDASDRVSGKTSIAAIIAAVISGIIAFVMGEGSALNKLNWASTIMSAVLCLGAAYSCSMIVTLPLLMASIRGKADKFAILGYGAAEEFSETNAILTEAKTIFPPSAVKINNICGYDKPKSRGEVRINIDEAIIYAASLAIAADSVMADALFNMLSYKQELLKPVSGCVYENNLGVMGWIDRRRVLLGSRAHMKAHEISVPGMKKEMAANVNNDEVVYLAIGGEVCLLFFVDLSADKSVRKSVANLAKNEVSIIIKTVDGMISAPTVAQVFGIEEQLVKVIPFENHETFNEHTKFVSRGSAALSCSGTFASFAGAITASKAIRTRIAMGCVMQLSGVALGILLTFIFMIFSNFSILNELNLLIFNIGWAVITLAVQYLNGLYSRFFENRRGGKDKEPPPAPEEPAAGSKE